MRFSLHLIGIVATFSLGAACKPEPPVSVAQCDAKKLVGEWQLYKARKQQFGDAWARLQPGDSLDSVHAICREHAPFFRELGAALDAHGESCGYSGSLNAEPDPTLPDRDLTFTRARKDVETRLSECEQVTKLARDGSIVREVEPDNAASPHH